MTCFDEVKGVAACWRNRTSVSSEFPCIIPKTCVRLQRDEASKVRKEAPRSSGVGKVLVLVTFSKTEWRNRAQGSAELIVQKTFDELYGMLHPCFIGNL